MKVLSFHQPRAEQIIQGLKTVDIRTWRVAHRGPLAVHASRTRRATRCRKLGFDPDALDYGAIIGTVTLADIVPLDEASYEALREQHQLDAPFPGSPCYAWHLADPRRLAAAMPCRGRRRLFDAEVGTGQEAAPPAIHTEEASGPDARLTGSRRTRRIPYHAGPLPEPDPERPFVLYTIPGPGGYRVALYQWLRHNGGNNANADIRSDVRSDLRSNDFADVLHPADGVHRGWSTSRMEYIRRR